MDAQGEQRQEALRRLASLTVGLEAGGDEVRENILADAIAHRITYTECIRERLYLRASLASLSRHVVDAPPVASPAAQARSLTTARFARLSATQLAGR